MRPQKWVLTFSPEFPPLFKAVFTAGPHLFHSCYKVSARRLQPLRPGYVTPGPPAILRKDMFPSRASKSSISTRDSSHSASTPCQIQTPEVAARCLALENKEKATPGMASWATELKRVCAKELLGSYGWQGASGPPEKQHPRYQGSEPTL